METITLSLTVEESNRVLNMLADYPFRDVADLIYKIRTQAEDQMAAKESAKATDPAKESPKTTETDSQ